MDMSDSYLDLPECVKVDIDRLIYMRGQDLNELLKWTKQQIKDRGGNHDIK